MKPEETIFDGISDSEMESIAGGTAEVYSLNLKENQPQVMVMLLNAVIIKGSRNSRKQ